MKQRKPGRVKRYVAMPPRSRWQPPQLWLTDRYIEATRSNTTCEERAVRLDRLLRAHRGEALVLPAEAYALETSSQAGDDNE